MLSYEERKKKTGELGEKLVSRYYRFLGLSVEKSSDKFDIKKDMLVDNKTCEVKAQQAWHVQNSFAVETDQLKKCNDVDILIFVETPTRFNNNTVRLYKMPKDKREVRTLITKDNRKMKLFSRNNAILLQIITNKDIVDEFKLYSSSKWK